MPQRTKVKAGDKFTRLTVIEIFTGFDNRTRALCECTCGKIKDIIPSQLTSGGFRSCGCLHREAAASQGRASKTHGFCRSKTYESWCKMKRMCLNEKDPNFYRYGGRGITVCEKWMEFQGFLEDMGERPPGTSIDRINNSLGYSKENCQWATPSQQARNRRSSKIVLFNQKPMTLAELSDQTSIPYGVIQARIGKGWSMEETLSIPIGEKRKSYAKRIKITDH